MLTIRQSTVLLRIPAGLAIRLKTTQRNQPEGWNAIIPADDGRSSRRTVKKFGTHLLPGVGNTPRDARAQALALALGRVSRAARDLAVEFVRVRLYPGFLLATLVIYPTSVHSAVTPPLPFDESAL